jgi:hypothetical protein
MSAKNYLGMSLVAMPFIWIFIWASAVHSLLFATLVYVAVALLFVVISVGVKIMND